jgi:uncharacterized membrane protein YkvA (DUF1232 family)
VGLDALTGVAVGVVVGLLVIWLVLVGALMIARPRGVPLGEAARLLPDLLRLLYRIARDRTVPRAARACLWLLLGYLAMPIDLVPDFIPVIGHVDDAIVVVLAVRVVVRRAGPEVLQRHWPGTPDGLAAVRRLVRV